MKFYVGLDISIETTSVCVVDDAGNFVREGIVESSPKPIAKFLAKEKRRCAAVGLEAGPISQWLYRELQQRKFPVTCLETRHAHSVLKARLNKTDRNDARGIAEIMRFGFFKAVHVKSLDRQVIKSLLNNRRFVQQKLIATEQCIRGTLHAFGIKLGHVVRKGYKAHVQKLLVKHPALSEIIQPLLHARQTLEEQFTALHKQVLAAAHSDEICHLLMTAPGVGPLVALVYRSTVDDPTRFKRSRSMGAHFGMTPRTYQSGGVDRRGKISHFGDSYLRHILRAAATIILRPNAKPSPLKVWGTRVAERRGAKIARTAVSRRLAVILHRIWLDRTPYRWEA
ncbi:IS110 family transposase [Labrys sp. ZIDIC5]|uniref:IS110 family transposase n=1 Tax=Labrys sedimenti TaxID=3106036 RepID=UPI002ACA7A68|nr:IS110 family transposase [Labrys sp. ZIDIC5]MDZ5448978.1 IS110 family transposase [Labrys sp. ZIDIC5]